MGNFNRDNNRSSGGRNFQRRDFDRNRNTDRTQQMYKAICSNCGKEALLPFKPSGDRPVYCRDCFPKFGGNEQRRDFKRDDRSSGDRPSFKRFTDNSNQSPRNDRLDAIDSKLDQILKLLNPDAPKAKQPVKEEKKEDVIPHALDQDLGIVIIKKKVVKKVSKPPVKTPIE